MMATHKNTNTDFREQPDLFSEPAEGSESMVLDAVDELFELSVRAYNTIQSAQMNESLGKTELEEYVGKLLKAARDAEQIAEQIAGHVAGQIAGHDGSSVPGKSGADIELAARSAVEKAAFDRGDPVVRTVLDAAYRVEREIHRLMGLLRFNPRSDGIWLARCAPDNFILPVFAEHFTLRFGEAPWAIIDEKRSLALVRLGGKEPCFGDLPSFPFLLDQSLPQDNWEELWRSYHHSVNIENRRNPRLQLQLMPRRYWKYLPEINSPGFSPGSL